MSDQATPKFPSIQTQIAYWEKHDTGGNVLPDRIEANEEHWKEPEWTLRDEVGESYGEIP